MPSNTNNRIHFIHPSCYDEQARVVKSRKITFPSRTLPYLAALTPPRYEVRITDEKVEPLDLNDDAGLVAITGTVHHIPRAIDLAREYKKLGRTVIIGGIGSYALQEQIMESGAFDSIVIGEAETCWETILEDYEKGQLKPSYQSPPLAELKGLPFARFDLLDEKHYMKSVNDPDHFIVTVETSRGCPRGCSFCSVSEYFGKKIRYRPVADVVEEIRFQKGNYFFFTDDNIAINADRARELFTALIPLGISWFGQFDLTVVNDPELIRLAARSGCRMAFIGVETLNEDNLIPLKKGHNVVNLQFSELMRRFTDTGIQPICSLMYGLEYDTEESIMETVKCMTDNKVRLILPWILTPAPRTELFDQLKKEGRILDFNYSLYDGVHHVFQHGNFAPGELEEVYWKAYRHFYKLRHILTRYLPTSNIKRYLRSVVWGLHMKNRVSHRNHPYNS